jgi:MATE family multidrug resistance protein
MTAAPATINRAIWAIALPSMVTNVATALFGLADIWVIGRLGEAATQGAVEIGAKLMMSLLMLFNFLRSGSVALTAQAAGRSDDEGQAAVLVRALAAALLVALILLAGRPLLVDIGLDMLGATGRVAEQAKVYVDIRYWGSLPWLLNAVLTGWLIGRRRLRAILAIEVGANVVHILLDGGLVLGVHLGVAGVAIATLSSESIKFVALAAIVAREPPFRRALALVKHRTTWAPQAIAELFRLNRDLFGRTLLLLTATILLTRSGAQQGAPILAANAIMFQMFLLSALILDGFESAAQVLCGEARGRHDRAAFVRAARSILLWGWGGGAAISLAYGLGGTAIAASFSADPAVIAMTARYVDWAAGLPLLGVASYVFDGVFIGATWTRALLISMAAALAVFVAALIVAAPLANDGLWLAFSIFLIGRGGTQAVMLPRLIRRSFGAQ